VAKSGRLLKKYQLPLMHARLKKYSMAFSTGSLYVNEVEAVLESFEQLEDWDKVRQKIEADNLLQQRAVRSIIRVTREVVTRAQHLSDLERDYFLQTSRLEQGYLVWIAVCRQYPFIAEFAVEVLRERYLTFMRTLSSEQFYDFFDQKTEIHPEIGKIKDSTKNNLRLVLFRMLKEADLIDETGAIRAPLMSKDLVRVIAHSNAGSFHFLPLFDGDIEALR
jgi:hypothetical protein